MNLIFGIARANRRSANRANRLGVLTVSVFSSVADEFLLDFGRVEKNFCDPRGIRTPVLLAENQAS